MHFFGGEPAELQEGDMVRSMHHCGVEATHVYDTRILSLIVDGRTRRPLADSFYFCECTETKASCQNPMCLPKGIALEGENAATLDVPGLVRQRSELLRFANWLLLRQATLHCFWNHKRSRKGRGGAGCHGYSDKKM